MILRSDVTAAMYDFSLTNEYLGMAIPARIPTITTTIKSSIKVNPWAH